MELAVLLLSNRGDGGRGGESGSLESHLEAISLSNSSTSFLLGLKKHNLHLKIQPVEVTIMTRSRERGVGGRGGNSGGGVSKEG